MLNYKKISVLLLCCFLGSLAKATEDSETATETADDSAAGNPPPGDHESEPIADEPRDMGGSGSYPKKNSVTSKDPSTDRFLQNPLFKDEEKQDSLSAQEKQKICSSIKSAYISYYDKVYKLEKNCRVNEMDTEQIYGLTRSKVLIQEVDGKTIQAFEIIGETKQAVVQRSCSSFNGRYVTFSYVDIYWVESCKKRLFPDWPTYEQHRVDKRLQKEPIIALTPEEFSALPSADPIISVIDEEYKKFSPVETVVELLSLDDACKGLLNQYVSYVDDIYFIQPVPKGIRGSDGTHCEKKPITDSYKFTKMHASKVTPIKELTSSQAVSIPTGSAKD